MLTLERAVVSYKVTPTRSAGALRSLWWGALRLPRRGAPSCRCPTHLTIPTCRNSSTIVSR